MELLRMISMLLVLIIHAITASEPWPIGQNEVLTDPLRSLCKLLVESLSVVCVNSFILLSGWYGIKFSFKRLLFFVFEVYFFSFALTFLHPETISFQSILDIVTLNQYWFVKAYVIVFILSPVLNRFAEQADKNVFEQVLIAFFLMQTVFSYISNTNWFDDGYSPLPFIGLYLLARYIRIHHPRFSSLGKGSDMGIYLGISLLLTSLSMLLYWKLGTGGRLFSYTNPLVIASSVFFLLFFSKLLIRNNRIINWLAVSSVGAYLLHMHPNFFKPFFIGTLSSVSQNHPGFHAFLLSCLFILGVFMAGILISKLYTLIWNGLTTKRV